MSCMRAQPAVSISVVMLEAHVPDMQVKSVRGREREPEFAQASV